MKKILFLLITFIFVININGQVFNKTIHINKYDEVLEIVEEKTIITVTDTSIVFDTKGKPSMVFNTNPYKCDILGSKSETANLVANVYGIQYDYLCLNNCKLYMNNINNLASFPNVLLKNYLVTITHRLISRFSINSSFYYDTEVWWIRYPDGSRTIFKL